MCPTRSEKDRPPAAGKPNIRVLEELGSIIWYSQRDGWGHLYLYDMATLELRHQITSESWAVADILYVDQPGCVLYFSAVGREPGRDPYHKHLYRVGLAELLTPEDADHTIQVSRRGQCFTDTYSRVDLPPVSVLRSMGGEIVTELARADIGLLLDTGWTMP